MTLSYGAFYTVIAICTVILVAFLFWGLSKISKRAGEHAGILLGILILVSGAVFFFFLKSLHIPVVEVRGFDTEEYVLVFTNSFAASDDQIVTLNEADDMGCVVINVTSQTMYVEKIDYGVLWDMDGTEPIEEVPAHSCTTMHEAPDFYPWDGTPGEIQVTKGTIAASRIWVHF